MNQRQLNREISQKTGESVATIAGLDFVPLTGRPYEREPLVVDWDQADAERNVAVFPQRSGTPAAV